MKPSDDRNDRVSLTSHATALRERATQRGRGFVWMIVAAGLLIGAAISCAGVQRADGLDPMTLPADVRDSYELFAQRCSKCHTLARPLNSNFTTIEEWRNYVRRMRRQPNSGISPQDEATILVFLQYYTEERNRTRGEAR